jgi:hypothetical protein
VTADNLARFPGERGCNPIPEKFESRAISLAVVPASVI